MIRWLIEPSFCGEISSILKQKLIKPLSQLVSISPTDCKLLVNVFTWDGSKKIFKTIFRVFSQISWDLPIYIYYIRQLLATTKEARAVSRLTTTYLFDRPKGSRGDAKTALPSLFHNQLFSPNEYIYQPSRSYEHLGRPRKKMSFVKYTWPWAFRR